MGMGRKGKLVKTNKARTLSETGKQVSGPKHYYTLKRNNSIVQLRTRSINVITKQSSSRGPQNIASTSRPEDSEFTTLYKRATKSIAEEISVDTIPEETTGYTFCDFLQKLQKKSLNFESIIRPITPSILNCIIIVHPIC